MSIGQQPKASPVIRTDAMLLQGIAMLSGTVSLILFPVVLRILGMYRLHKLIPISLCQDGGCGDGKICAVALNDTTMWDLVVGAEEFSVDKKLIRSGA